MQQGASCTSNTSIRNFKLYFRGLHAQVTGGLVTLNNTLVTVFSRGLHAKVTGGLVTLNNILLVVYSRGFMPK